MWYFFLQEWGGANAMGLNGRSQEWLHTQSLMNSLSEYAATIVPSPVVLVSRKQESPMSGYAQARLPCHARRSPAGYISM